jgi:hypothetical protein
MSKSNCTKIHPGRDPGPRSVPKCGIGKFDPSNRYFFSDCKLNNEMYTHSMANENDMEWFTPGKSCKKCDTN